MKNPLPPVLSPGGTGRGGERAAAKFRVEGTADAADHEETLLGSSATCSVTYFTTTDKEPD